MTAEVAAASDFATARARIDRIAAHVAASRQDIIDAHASRDWLALGYGSWAELCEAEFRGAMIGLPRSERREAVAELTDAGMSVRAIGAALGVSKSQVSDDRRSGVQNRTPDELPAPVTGLDGKTYTRPTRKVTVVEEVTVDAETGEIVDSAPSHGDALVQDLIDSSPDMRAANVRKRFSKWLLDVSQYHLFNPAEVAHVAPDRLGDLDAFVRGINQMAETYKATVLEMNRPQLRSVK